MLPETYNCRSGYIYEVLIFGNFARRTNSQIQEYRENYFYNIANKEEKWKFVNSKFREKFQNQKFAKIKTRENYQIYSIRFQTSFRPNKNVIDIDNIFCDRFSANERFRFCRLLFFKNDINQQFSSVWVKMAKWHVGLLRLIRQYCQVKRKSHSVPLKLKGGIYLKSGSYDPLHSEGNISNTTHQQV